jgi:glycine cleavage system T protein
VEEHRLCRRSIALFDIDHMGQVLVSGRGAGAALSSLVSGPILDMARGEARYGLLLNEQGGIIDDLFIYRLGEEEWFVVVNAGNRETDLAWFRSRLAPGILVEDLSDALCMIACQGPKAVELLDRLSGGAVSGIRRSFMAEISPAGVPCRAGRTGYTGEDGAELYCGPDRALELWEALLGEAEKAGLEAGPAGLAARDSLRFEAGMPLHGHEIGVDITPFEALLSWACDFEKDFTGKAALLARKEAGLKRKLITLNVTGGVPREGYPVLNAGDEEIGRCVAGMFCPSTGTYSANAFADPAYAKPGTKLKVSIRGNHREAVVIKRPLYIPVYRRGT